MRHIENMTPKYTPSGKLYYKNKNFTSTDYYSNTYMTSFKDKYWYRVTIGSRGRGKTYSGKKYVIKRILEQIKGQDVTKINFRKFMWWRLTNDAVTKVLENNGSTFFEKELLERYHIVVKVVNSDIFFAKDNDYTADSDGNKLYNYFHVGKVASIQEYYKYKGNQLNDYDWIIMDELVRAESERRTFNIPKAFVNMIENVCRKRKGIKVFIYANAIGEMQEIKQLFGFMPLPGRFGVYKLHHKRTIIEYLDDSEEWKQEQAKTMAGVLQSSSEFTNKHENGMDDRDDWFIERKDATGRRYFMSLKIKKGIYLDISLYKGYYYIDTDNYTPKAMQFSNCYALDRELVSSKAIFSQEIPKMLKELWDNGKFRFASRISYQWFTESLKNYNII